MAARDQFKLTGIQRNRKNREFKPGSCNELINLRFREGAWECVGNKKLYDTITGYTPVKILAFHDMLEAKNIIFLTDTGNIVSKTFGGGYQLLIEDTSLSINIEATTLNNVLIFTDNVNFIYFIFKDNSYLEVVNRFNDFKIYLGEEWDGEIEEWGRYTGDFLMYFTYATPKLPDGTSIYESSNWRVIKAFYRTFPNETYKEGVIAGFNEMREIALKDGVPVGKISMIATIVLFDDTEISHTNISEFEVAHILHAISTDSNHFSLFSKVLNNDYGFKFYVKGLPVDTSLIKGIRIYLNRPLTPSSGEFKNGTEQPYFVKSQFCAFSTEASLTVITPFYLPSTEESLFREVAYISIDDIDRSTDLWSFTTRFYDLTLIDTYKELPIDNFSKHKLTGKTPINYNGRIFASNIKTTFPQPSNDFKLITRKDRVSRLVTGSIPTWTDSQKVENFNAFWWQKSISDPDYREDVGVWDGRTWAPLLSGIELSYSPSERFEISINSYESEVIYDVVIATDEGEITLRSNPKTIRGYTMSGDVVGKRIQIKGVLSYPDTRAKRIIIYVKPLRCKKPNESLGYAVLYDYEFNVSGYYKKELSLKPSDSLNTSFVDADFIINSPDDFEVQPDGITLIQLPVISGEDTITDINRVQASALNNPFIFPAANSYRVGNSEIIGLQTVNNEMSQGQFGDFPMIAFTKSGIWAMKIGSGDLLISSVVPLANELCNNPDSIVAIRKGILFSTVEGLKILQGSNVLDISDMLEGSPDSAVKSGSIMSQIINAEGFMASVSDIDFLEYVKGARVGYDDYNEELIVSNPTKHYSYIFSIINNSWSKTDQVYDGFLSKYPFLLAFKGGAVYKTNEELKVSKKGLFITNEISFNNTFTKIEQALLRGKFKSGRIIIFGTTDNVTWKLICIGTSNTGGYDIQIPRSFYSCLAFVIAFDGSFEGDSYLQHIDFEIKQRYGLKFR